MRLGLVVLADLSVRIGAGGIEVAQSRPAEAARDAEPVQRALHADLRLAVGVDRPQRQGLPDGDLVGGRDAGAERRKAKANMK